MKYRKTMLALLVLGGLVLTTAPLALAAPASALSCGEDCSGGGDGGSGGTTSGSSLTVCSSGYISNTNANSSWLDTGAANVNDVAAGPDGSVWYITGTPDTAGTTVRVSGGSTAQPGIINQGGKRIAIDPQGNPWIVDFNGHIWHLVNGSFQELSTGLARDIGVAPNGTVWVIGTNSLNGSFQVWSWNGSTWTANAGSGEEIDVAANSDPVVNGYDGKVWIMDGGANSGWSQVIGIPSTFDMGLSKCSPVGQADVGGSAMWIAANPISDGGRLLYSLGALNSSGTLLTGPYTTTNSGPVVEQFLNGKFQVTASHVAVDNLGVAWVVADPGNCDCPGELLERPFN